jgi:hypothetical protein
MSVLGILTCEILELEFAHLLGAESGWTRVTVLEDAGSARLIAALESRGMECLRGIPHVKWFTREPGDGIEVLIRVLPVALHRTKRALRHGLIAAAREMAHHVDALLLGYGLCGNALERTDELLGGCGVPVFVPMDGDHPVDDCVGLLIGGRETYYAEQRSVPGTFFMTPGWTHHWRRVLLQECAGGKVEMARKMLGRYERSLLVLTPAMTESEMKRKVEPFNELFGLGVETRDGSMEILGSALNAAREHLKTAGGMVAGEGGT